MKQAECGWKAGLSEVLRTSGVIMYLGLHQLGYGAWLSQVAWVPHGGLIGMQVPQPHLDSHPRVCVLMILGSRALIAVNRPDLFSEATLNYWLGEGQK